MGLFFADISVERRESMLAAICVQNQHNEHKETNKKHSKVLPVKEKLTTSKEKREKRNNL